MLVESYVKAPEAFKDYGLNWAQYLGSDTIVTSTWTASSASVTLSDAVILGGITVVWVDGGVAGELVDLHNHVVTAGGRKDARTLRLILRD